MILKDVYKEQTCLPSSNENSEIFYINFLVELL